MCGTTLLHHLMCKCCAHENPFRHVFKTLTFLCASSLLLCSSSLFLFSVFVYMHWLATPGMCCQQKHTSDYISGLSSSPLTRPKNRPNHFGNLKIIPEQIRDLALRTCCTSHYNLEQTRGEEERGFFGDFAKQIVSPVQNSCCLGPALLVKFGESCSVHLAVEGGTEPPSFAHFPAGSTRIEQP